MVFALDLVTNIFHDFAEYLYGNNMQEQQNWEAGKYFLSSLNFGGLENSHSFQVGEEELACRFADSRLAGHFLQRSVLRSAES